MLDVRALELEEAYYLPERSIVLQLIMMIDSTWLCLFKADFSNKQSIKGNLRVKIGIKDIDEFVEDKAEPKKLTIKTKVSDQLIIASLIFDNPLRAAESREFLQFNKEQHPLKESERVEVFLQSQINF